MTELSQLVLHGAMAISLAACAGLRVFLPLFVLGVAGRLEIVSLSEGFSWLASWPALVVFGGAVVMEMLADKFPLVDHALDTVQLGLKPVAGALITCALVADWSPLYLTVVGIVAGGSVAGSVHLAKASLRLVSSVATGGTGNVVLSVGEDAGALVGSLGAFLFPFVIAAAAIVGLVVVWFVLRRLKGRTRGQALKLDSGPIPRPGS